MIHWDSKYHFQEFSIAQKYGIPSNRRSIDLYIGLNTKCPWNDMIPVLVQSMSRFKCTDIVLVSPSSRSYSGLVPRPLISRDFILTEIMSLIQIEIMKKVR